MKSKLSTLLFIFLFFITLTANSWSDDPNSLTYLNDGKSPSPLTYFDSVSKIVFYVESDGRHVTAIDYKGHILWHRNVFKEALQSGSLTAYNVTKPYIIAIRKDTSQKLTIGYDSGEWFLLNSTTGDSMFLGVN